MKKQYYPVRAMLDMIPEPNRSACIEILDENKELFDAARVSSRSHQAWQGGYIAHIEETMNIAIVLYGSLSNLRLMSFDVSDALLVLFLHDIENPWKYKTGKAGRVVIKRSLSSRTAQRQFREKIFKKYRIKFTSTQRNALRYIEGEGNGHPAHKRVMQQLCAFCHMVDTCSARMWPDEPFSGDDTWKLW